jgi:hypothetical protein
MSMAVRMRDPVTGEHFSFHPERCVERFYPRVIEVAMQGIQEKNWEPWFATYLAEKGITEQQLCETLKAYAAFVDLSLDPEITSVRGALTESKFLECPVPAQLVVLAKVGQLCAGTFWVGVRNSVEVGVVPAPIQAMRKGAQQFEAYVSARWNKDAEQGDQLTVSSDPPNGEIASSQTSRERE